MKTKEGGPERLLEPPGTFPGSPSAYRNAARPRNLFLPELSREFAGPCC
jgi:hypothetical protein